MFSARVECAAAKMFKMKRSEFYFRFRWLASPFAALILLGLFNSSLAITITSEPSFTRTTNAPLAGTLSLNTDVPSQVNITVSDGFEVWKRSFQGYATNHFIPLFGFKPGRTNELTVTVRDRTQNRLTASTPVIFVTGSLPDDFPNIRLLGVDRTKIEPGYTLFRVDVNRNTYGYVVLVDSSGDVVWYGKTPSTLDVRQLENGHLFMPSNNAFVEINLLGETINTWPVLNSLPINYHDGFPTRHGTILYLSDWGETVTDFPTSLTDPNAPTATSRIQYERVVEISAINSNPLIVWQPVMVLDPRRISYLSGRSAGVWDSEHSNAVIEDPSDGSVIVSMRNQNAVIKFSRATGQLRWILGPHDGWGPEWQPFLLKPVGTPFEWQYGQHSPVISPQGTLVIFDNGNYRAMPFNAPVFDTNNYSRAVEYRIDEAKMEVSQVWDYGRTNAPERLYADHEGSAEPLSKTGNVLIGFPAVSYVNGVPPSSFGSAATMARIQEVTHDLIPQVVFDLAITMYDKTNSVFKNCSLYRCQRVPDLYGHPALAVTDLNVTVDNGVAHLLFSGDPIRKYTLEVSTDLRSWNEMATVEPDPEGVCDFQDDFFDFSAYKYYRVVTR
ncbi:MAG: Arylsulfotransferase [Verrucomicrobiales bacterium]|nr:Arylsulfotransferase [Verrucomicrobiales bacterium]